MAPKKTSKKRYPVRKSTGAKAHRKQLGSGPAKSDANPTDTDLSPIEGRRKRKTSPNINSANDERVLDYQTDFAKTPPDAQARFAFVSSDYVLILTPSGAEELTAEAIENAGWAFFTCPACELLRQEKKTKFVYNGFYGSDGKPMEKTIISINNKQFTFFKPVKLQKLAIVQLQCNGASTDFEMPFKYMALRAATYASGVVSVEDVLKNGLTSPAITNLASSQPQPLLTANVTFDLDSPEGLAEHARSMVDLRNALDAMSVNQVIFILVTHSDPETGDLHYTADGGGAEELAVVMDALLPTAIQNWLCERSAYLFFLVCGAKPLTKDGGLTATPRKVFQHAFLFPTAHLQPSQVTLFASDLVEQVHMHNLILERAVMLTLQNLPSLGLHTRILRISARTDLAGKPFAAATRYVWSHYKRRPWGLDAPTFCVVCNSVKSFDKSNHITDPNGSFAVEFKCSGELKCSGPASKEASLTRCANAVMIPLSSCEGKLVKGTKDPCGLWQEHEFTWDAGVLRRF
ncbi:hypothetical protein K435DRAFT_852380 [Dendrothele bispora CBS 962.96]|uniref:Uncharacterized protein n=1 Tax=Dendrothele bispora (strain CBS 962.96) TaxID=1314807 RepID=A0A4S8ML36_DENBC|nr:hypothetical protein K435DRAFT_852380 [Dendrothele bispora CBS 962.96]